MSGAGAIEVRPFEDADEDAVAALWREVFADDPPWNEPRRVMSKKRAVQRDLFLVAKENGVLAGTALGGYDGHRGWVYAVAVRPDSRRRGIGAMLMARLETALLEIGCPKINLQVRAGNEAVVAFYRRLGYRVEERVSMGKLLQPASGKTERRGVAGRGTN